MLREKKINRQGQVRDSKGIQRWIKRQRKIDYYLNGVLSLFLLLML